MLNVAECNTKYNEKPTVPFPSQFDRYEIQFCNSETHMVAKVKLIWLPK